ncbi:tRNA (adenosine(37)-N6)-threonylcarbamoyltransferase complex ATPase subunit type 1 TsaE [Subsaxibacter sp. CAU 1640]|uniref:tRNA (adenosine(37)-N6)-threonylcarbamoyltransferase complex ATPase subunit type 1 TsaE n=1 Tax=Subsaxibacter sp. CAU 1640 TaxID=2933271 RepID=UPI0020051328|nr:tRNA (adenosine(37)-N6)-threonylcarbamoyltransferase complex ATPase subunit type 1 TsaE [Subsaxibacter sp. CAU 1640]MCK7591021.1 tRNA (adenosine(37)-N6)-threonylcarbamoyltransferase complex ATPase subunit type 1 TsaE [Subsaxibacter sp. CAU 1640]
MHKSVEFQYQLGDIELITKQVLDALTSKNILLFGSMGVGKTTFVSALLKILGSHDDASSPTFSIVNEYELPNDMMYHFDMYRIKDEDEALQFGFEDYLSSNHWIVIEWPERIPNLLPENAEIIEIILNSDYTRTLKLNNKIDLTNKNMAKNCIN